MAYQELVDEILKGVGGKEKYQWGDPLHHKTAF